MNDELVTLLTERLFECTVTVHPRKSVIVDGIEMKLLYETARIILLTWFTVAILYLAFVQFMVYFASS